jgi:DNA (cytosine-5)-methyltransferase 1
MQGLPAGWLTADPQPAGMTASQVRNAQLKAAGNGVVPQQAEAALRLLVARASADPRPAVTA